MSEANVFIIINLGCEMLYVIDQRLKAQEVPHQKSVQVMKDITSVLLDPKFIEKLILGSQQNSVITQDHCKTLLNDIAQCSLMRMDFVSMGKLWDLMTVIFKWQLFLSNHPQHLLDITFRHLDGVGKIFPEVKKSILVDYTKNNILDFWNLQESSGQENIFKSIRMWLDEYSVKVSILIRLGFQRVDGSFVKNSTEEYFESFVQSTGDNIYKKSAEITEETIQKTNTVLSSAIEHFAGESKTPSSEITVGRNIVFDDFQLDVDNTEKQQPKTEFIELKTERSSTSSWESLILKGNKADKMDLNSLLNTKLS